MYKNVICGTDNVELCRSRYCMEKAMATHSSTLAWKIHGQRSLVCYSPRGHEESDMTERLHFHFSFSCIGEGNGNTLQCSCLENPRDGEAWWAVAMGSHRVRHNWRDLAAAAAAITVCDWSWHHFRFDHHNFRVLYVTPLETTKKISIKYTQGELKKESKHYYKESLNI